MGCNLDLVAGYPVPLVLFMTDISFKPMFKKYRPDLYPDPLGYVIQSLFHDPI